MYRWKREEKTGVGASPGQKRVVVWKSTEPSPCTEQRVPCALNRTRWCFRMITQRVGNPCSAAAPRRGSCPCAMGPRCDGGVHPVTLAWSQQAAGCISGAFAPQHESSNTTPASARTVSYTSAALVKLFFSFLIWKKLSLHLSCV